MTKAHSAGFAGSVWFRPSSQSFAWQTADRTLVLVGARQGLVLDLLRWASLVMQRASLVMQCASMS